MKRSDVVNTAKKLVSHDKVISVYNSMKNIPRGYKIKDSDPWCASFVTVVFALNGYYDFAECSCYEMLKKADKKGMWIESDYYEPCVGDVIMYDWQDSGHGDNSGYPDHVGIVIDVTNRKITVREGNKAGDIGNRVLDVNGKYIRGFITPPFEKEKDKYKTVDDIVTGIYKGDFGNGEATRSKKLYDYFQKKVMDKYYK